MDPEAPKIEKEYHGKNIPTMPAKAAIKTNFLCLLIVWKFINVSFSMKKYEIDLLFASILQKYYTPIMHNFPNSVYPEDPLV